MANQSKFTPDRAAVIIEALESGNPWTHACGLACIDQKTGRRWLEQGAATEDPADPFRMFYLAVAEANAKAAAYALGMVHDAMPKDWRAAMAFLERRFPDDYTKRERREISGPGDGPVEVVLQWPSGAEPPR